MTQNHIFQEYLEITKDRAELMVRLVEQGEQHARELRELDTRYQRFRADADVQIQGYQRQVEQLRFSYEQKIRELNDTIQGLSMTLHEHEKIRAEENL